MGMKILKYEGIDKHNLDLLYGIRLKSGPRYIHLIDYDYVNSWEETMECIGGKDVADRSCWGDFYTGKRRLKLNRAWG